MSWTQGVTLRKDIPEYLIKHLEARSLGTVAAIVWEPIIQPLEFMVMYYSEGEFYETKTFRMKRANDERQ